MKLVKFEKSHNKVRISNFVNSDATLKTEKNKKSSSDQDIESNTSIKKKRNCKYIIISIIISIIIVSGIVVGILFWKKSKDEPENPSGPINPLPPHLNIKEALAATSKLFNISSKINTLTQFSQKTIQKQESISDGQKTSNNILSKATIDLITINSTTPSDKYINFYSTLYTTVITVNSFCSKYSKDPENDDCELKKALDLNILEENNLRRNEENIEDIIREAILPICFIEHTDTNQILSLNCPETLAPNFKDDMLQAFATIKPRAMKGFDFDKNYVNTNVEEKDDKIYINYFDKVCLEPNFDDNINIECDLIKSIITDKEGNLISSKTSNTTKSIYDGNNSFFSRFTYEFKNIPKEISDSFDQEKYKKNLNSLYSIFGKIFKKEIVFNNFTDFIEDLMTDNNESNRRNLIEEEEESKNPGVHEEKIFTKNILNILIDYNYLNDLGLGEGQSAKSISSQNINNEEYNELSGYRIQTKLSEILNQFITISKSVNKIADDFKSNLNEPLLNIRDKINENIEKINNMLVNKDLSEIFDSTLAIKELTSLPYSFITATDNLYESINDLEEKLLYTIENTRKKLKEDISTYLEVSHNLIFKLFNNLKEVSEILSSEQSKIMEMVSYHLNDTDTSYYDIIQKATNILNDYPEKEKALIIPLVDKILEKFYSNAINYIEKYQTQLDQISERLDNGDLMISLASNEDYKNTIRNIYNSRVKISQIVETIKQKFLESINLQSNGYFETQKELDENRQVFEKIEEKATKIAYDIDKNELSDKAFTKIMTSFRDKFIELLNHMKDLTVQKFPNEENVLSTSLYNEIFLKGLDEFLNNEIVKILNFVKNENDNYLKSMNDILSVFKNENGKNLEQLMSNLLTGMTDIILDNLNSAYNDSLYNTFNNINKLIKDNSKLAEQYINEVIKKKSYHITKGFTNKYNTFYKSLDNIEIYINKNLKNYLANKYKNAITQIRAFLQSIKSNSILEKYYNQLPLASKHLNAIKDLFNIFNRHISDKYYNNKFKPLIDKFIKQAKDDLKAKKLNIQKLYNTMSKKKSNKLYEDYDKERIVKGKRYCSKRRWYCFGCCRHSYYPDKYFYDGYNVTSTKNTAKLNKLNLAKYTANFDTKYKKLYKSVSKNVLDYNSLLTQLDTKIKIKKSESYTNDATYLDKMKQKFDNILEENLGPNLLSSSYNYYKNKINSVLPDILNEIIIKWENAYDETYNEVEANKDKFKSSVFEFFYLGSFYLQVYSQNISYDNVKTIVDHLKNEFNYTNKYYYDLITSKLNNTYDYILNNLPRIEKPFDDIINLRMNEIKKSRLETLNKIQQSKNNILNKANQEKILQVNSKNFFYINDMIKNHIKDFNNKINDKSVELYLLCKEIQKDTPVEYIAEKYLLENSINGKQIKENYEMINQATFIDLQTNEFNKLMDNVLKIDRDEFIKNVLNTLNKLNAINLERFNYEYQSYTKILHNKLYEEFFTEENLIKNINSLYSKGLNNFNINSKQNIINLLNDVINKVNTHLKTEATRLSNELTSYSNDYNDIETRLKNYKNSIYEQFYSTITYAVNGIHEQILEKFYKNFIEKGINQYEKEIDDHDFGTANFLNMSINLNEYIDKDFKLYLIEYGNLAKNQIQFLFQKNIQTLDEIFNFNDIKLKINNEIDEVYKTSLLPVLQKVAVHKIKDEGVTNYDLSDSILNDIDQLFAQKIKNVKNIMKEMEGKEYQISNRIPADFSAGENNIYDDIIYKFKKFCSSYESQEIKDFENIVVENALNNFKILVGNFIPNFGVNFFDRILKYNEIQKINVLYFNLRYSLIETIIYYISLATVQNDIKLPVEIKLKLFKLNNFDFVVKEKNDYILSTINNKLDEYFEKTKNYIVNKYINEMTISEEFDLKFTDKAKKKIIGIMSGNAHKYENEYINRINKDIKNHFIEEYKTNLNEATNYMKYFIELQQIQLKAEMDKIFNIDSDLVFTEIEKKLNNTINAIAEYNKHNYSISEEVNMFLINFGENMIEPKYKNIKELLDKRTEELIFNNLEKLSNEFITQYSFNNFEAIVDQSNKNLSSSINSINTIINKYGSIEEVYKQNLEIEIANLDGKKIIEEISAKDNNTEENRNEVILDKTFGEIKNYSLNIKDFVQSLDLFNNFENDINSYINEKNKQYSYTLYNLEKNKNNYYELMSEKLEELNQISIEYYSKVKNIYNTMKEELIKNITEINNLLISCEQVTYKVQRKLLNEIKEKFNRVEDSQNSTKKKINIESYKTQQNESHFTLDTKVENYLTKNKFTLDIVFEEDSKNYKIIGNMISILNPEIYFIDFYSSTGIGGKIGREININFNNITSFSNIVYDTGLNQVNILTNFNFDEYSIKTQYYEQRNEVISKNIGGMVILIKSVDTRVDIETPENEKFCQNPAKNITLAENYLF